MEEQVVQEKKEWGYGTGLMVGIVYLIATWVLAAVMQWVVSQAVSTTIPMVISSIVNILAFIGYVGLIVFAFVKGQKRFGWGVLSVMFAGVALAIVVVVIGIVMFGLTN